MDVINIDTREICLCHNKCLAELICKIIHLAQKYEC